jgi:hypothetical protein
MIAESELQASATATSRQATAEKTIQDQIEDQEET